MTSNPTFPRDRESCNTLKPRYKPVWKLAAGRYGNNRWIVFSIRLMRLVILYSDLEYDHWVLVESDFRIAIYCEQPLKVRVRLATGLVTTVFDMWVRYVSGAEELREVKYRNQCNEPKVRRQLAAQRLWCRLKPSALQLYDEFKIRENLLYLSNWKRILSCLGATHRLDLTQLSLKVLRLLSDSGGKTLSELESCFAGTDRTLVQAATFRLLHGGQLMAALDTEPLSGAILLEVRR